jgi:hypothetical protein
VDRPVTEEFLHDFIMLLHKMFKQSKLEPLIRLHSPVVNVVPSSNAIICYLLVLAIQKPPFVIASYIIPGTYPYAMGLNIIGNADPFQIAIFRPLYTIHFFPTLKLRFFGF